MPALSLETIIYILITVSIVLIAASTYYYITEYYSEKTLNENVNVESFSYIVTDPPDLSTVPIYYKMDKNGTITDTWFYITIGSTYSNLDKVGTIPLTITNAIPKNFEIIKIGTTTYKGYVYYLYRVKVHLDPNSYSGGVLTFRVKDKIISIVGTMVKVSLYVIYPINNTDVYQGQLPIRIKNVGENYTIKSLEIKIDTTTIYKNVNVNKTLSLEDVYTTNIDISGVTEGKHNLTIIVNDGDFIETLTINVKRRPNIIIKNVTITPINNKNGTIFQFNITLYNQGHNTILINPNTTTVMMGKQQLENVTPSSTIINPNDEVNIIAYKRLIPPGDTYIYVNISNYRTNNYPITIKKVRNIYPISTITNITNMTMTIRNTGNIYFRFVSIQIYIGNKKVELLKTPTVGTPIGVMETFNVTYSIDGILPNKTYPLKIILNNEIIFKGEIFVPYSQYIHILNVTASETELDINAMYIGNKELHYIKGNVTLEITNNTTPILYLLYDKYSNTTTNYSPQLKFDLPIIQEPNGERYKNNDIFMVVAKIPFPLAGTYKVNLTVTDDSGNVTGVTTTPIFSVLRGITIIKVPYSTTTIMSNTTLIGYTPNAYEPLLKISSSQKYSGTRVKMMIVIKNKITGTIITNMMDNVPLWVPINEIKYPLIQDIDTPTIKNLPALNCKGKLKINSYMSTPPKPPELKIYMWNASNYYLPNFDPTKYNITKITPITNDIKYENITVKTLGLDYWFVPYFDASKQIKLLPITEQTQNDNYNTFIARSLLPQLIINGKNTLHINSSIYDVRDYGYLHSNTINVIHNINSSYESGSQINFETIKLSSKTTNKLYAYNNISNFNMFTKETTLGIDAIEYEIGELISEYYGQITIDVPNILIKLPIPNSQIEKQYIYTFTTQTPYTEPNHMFMYKYPYNITIGTITFTTLSIRKESIPYKSGHFEYTYRDLTQLTSYDLVMYNEKTPYIRQEPTNFTVLLRVNIYQTIPSSTLSDIRRKMIYDYSDSDLLTTLQFVSNEITGQIISTKQIIPYITPVLKGYYIYNIFSYYYPIEMIYLTHNDTMVRKYLRNIEQVNNTIIMYKVYLNKTFVGDQSLTNLNIQTQNLNPTILTPYLTPIFYNNIIHYYQIYMENTIIPFILPSNYSISNNTITISGVTLQKEINATVTTIIRRIQLNHEIYNEQQYGDKTELNLTLNYENITNIIIASLKYIPIKMKFGEQNTIVYIPSLISYMVPIKITTNTIMEISQPNFYGGRIQIFTMMHNPSKDINEMTIITNIISKSIQNIITNELTENTMFTTSTKGIPFTEMMIDPMYAPFTVNIQNPQYISETMIILVTTPPNYSYTNS